MTPDNNVEIQPAGHCLLYLSDGSTVLYTQTQIDLQTEARRTNIIKYLHQGVNPSSLPLMTAAHLSGSLMEK